MFKLTGLGTDWAWTQLHNTKKYVPKAATSTLPLSSRRRCRGCVRIILENDGSTASSPVSLTRISMFHQSLKASSSEPKDDRWSPYSTDGQTFSPSRHCSHAVLQERYCNHRCTCFLFPVFFLHQSVSSLAGDTSRGARNEEQKLTVLHFALPSSSLYYVHLRSQYDPATTSTVVDHS